MRFERLALVLLCGIGAGCAALEARPISRAKAGPAPSAIGAPRPARALAAEDNPRSWTNALPVTGAAWDESIPPVDVEGLWIWERRDSMPGGDEKVEREEWHLLQEGSSVSGYYDRAVRHVSTDGQAFRCNGALDIRVVTRYQLTGVVRGSTVILHERTYEILEGSPCDDGRRRLDVYQGQAGNDEIHLLWGMGRQVLKRGRPNLPTQRF